MYQMAFGFCPICGNVYIVFVDADWLIDPDIPPFPCENCFDNVLTQDQRDSIERALTELEKKAGDTNGA